MTEPSKPLMEAMDILLNYKSEAIRRQTVRELKMVYIDDRNAIGYDVDDYIRAASEWGESVDSVAGAALRSACGSYLHKQLGTWVDVVKCDDVHGGYIVYYVEKEKSEEADSD